MSRKNNLLKFKMVVNGDMSLASITSSAVSIHWLDNIGIQLNFSGSPTGSFQIQVSADYAADAEGNVQNAGNWVPITLPSSPVASGAPGVIYIDLNQLSAPWIRVVYTRSSGSGLLNAFLTAKMI